MTWHAGKVVAESGPEAEREAPSATLASGVGVLAVASVLGLVLMQARATLCAPEPEPSNPLCATPVEVSNGAQAHLACAGDAQLTACGQLVAGDRVEMTAERCTVVRGGMSGAARLLSDLPLDLNRASAEELALLEGVGPKIAAQIVADRDAHGPFSSVDALARVHGVGEKTVARLRAYLVAGAP